eukprot:scaffold92310_cov26-Prasinocladus_malaysianus.AAC.1
MVASRYNAMQTIFLALFQYNSNVKCTHMHERCNTAPNELLKFHFKNNAKLLVLPRQVTMINKAGSINAFAYHKYIWNESNKRAKRTD